LSIYSFILVLKKIVHYANIVDYLSDLINKWDFSFFGKKHYATK